ncbi:MAG TPA: hypothetical protein ACFYEK_04705 [Candidatus Wunengus sp. YC60]|jgi:hypothetical protein|uniref:hypothetical protein n=1 Tax=Candidatus Wunengus sp. YC60 TaxID=3367697 RepID=UPI004026810A
MTKTLKCEKCGSAKQIETDDQKFMDKLIKRFDARHRRCRPTTGKPGGKNGDK